MTALELPVSEVFGPTLQGEGPHQGRAVQFIRLGGCNLSCSWCDTPYTWDASRYNLREENPLTPVTDVLARVMPSLPVVVSGGEPLIHQAKPAWTALLQGLRSRDCSVHVETNGTINPNDVTRTYVDHYSVSPKLPHAGLHKRSQNPTMSRGWTAGRFPNGVTKCLKVVVRTDADVMRAFGLADDYGWPLGDLWVMPEGTTTEELQSRWTLIAETAAQLGINASHRLHVLAWGDRKGT
ncbi:MULTISPECIES: 7-carboxy-7-deazaguanine synthase QueE [Mycolicibacterium]|uniref:7-carboxy-7-deazaguanine synthase QueE n=1 Tax=Mycolicibacterium TaxID=1866885 RepID=UPI001CDB8F55|nr:MULTISPECIES: 7-carboxy-7-deazaguanine synthase QueE [Mycolicibacterium]MCC9181091.1 7-carboxy-7-deazaguanine synthase QueE [Mycolicibacterium mageritense]UBV14808.1 7-carboxy-7-deazaguanine synthase QueE [Mycolicibacterium fortuitum]